MPPTKAADQKDLDLFQLWCSEGRDPDTFPWVEQLTQDDIDWAARRAQREGKK